MNMRCPICGEEIDMFYCDVIFKQTVTSYRIMEDGVKVERWDAIDGRVTGIRWRMFFAQNVLRFSHYFPKLIQKNSSMDGFYWCQGA